MEKAYANDWQILVHANGDAAIDLFIKAVKAAKHKYPNVDNRPANISPIGWVLEHGMIFGTHHDAPMALPDSMRVLSATVTRRSRSGAVIRSQSPGFCGNGTQGDDTLAGLAALRRGSKRLD